MTAALLNICRLRFVRILLFLGRLEGGEHPCTRSCKTAKYFQNSLHNIFQAYVQFLVYCFFL